VSATTSWVGRFMTDLANTRPYTLASEDGEFLAPGMPFSLRETVVLGQVPARMLVAARASLMIPGTRVTFWLHARNLANRLYVTDLANGLRPGAGRTVTAGARVQF
jgi:Fe(3+) dicitrate transport protein